MSHTLSKTLSILSILFTLNISAINCNKGGDYCPKDQICCSSLDEWNGIGGFGTCRKIDDCNGWLVNGCTKGSGLIWSSNSQTCINPSQKGCIINQKPPKVNFRNDATRDDCTFKSWNGTTLIATCSYNDDYKSSGKGYGDKSIPYSMQECVNDVEINNCRTSTSTVDLKKGPRPLKC
jgi:hypothetical protein